MDDDASHSINIDIIHNHLNIHNYTGVKEIKHNHTKFQVNNISSNAHMFWQNLKLKSTFYSSNFPFINIGTRTNARHTIDTKPLSFALPLCLFHF